MIYEEAFNKAKDIYGITEEQWDGYIEIYLTKVKEQGILPDGFELLKDNSNYAISKNGIIISTIDLVPLKPKRAKVNKVLAVKIDDEYSAISYLMAVQYLGYKDGVVEHMDGDIYNVILDNLSILGADEKKQGVPSKLKITTLNNLSKGLKSAKMYNGVTNIKTSYKSIKDVKSGDLVVSFDKGTIVASPVISSIDVIVKEEDQICIRTEFGSFTTSKKHPVPIFENRDSAYDIDNDDISWVPAMDVLNNDTTLVNDNGNVLKVKVTEVLQGSKDENFRDLSIKDTKCYFIKGTDGKDQLVHNTRKGSIAVYIETWHMDMFNFLESKNNATEERLSATDLFHAVWANELFFEREEADENWTLFDPYYCRDLHTLYGDAFKKRYEEYEKDDSIPKKTIKAKDLMKSILVLYAETGSPFITLKDEANRRHQCENIDVIRSTNLCTEIFNATSPGIPRVIVSLSDGTSMDVDETDIITTDKGIKKLPMKLNQIDKINDVNVASVKLYNSDKRTSVCNLSSINLGKMDFTTDVDGTTLSERKEKMLLELKHIVTVIVRALDNVIDINYYPVENAMKTNLENRSIGLGVMGEHHFLILNRIMYGSQEHFELIDELYERVSYYAIEASIELAKEKGVYPAFKGSAWSKGILPIDTANKLAEKLTTREYSMDWESLRERVKNGIRNGYLLAIAPTSSISVYTSTTSSVEPIYKRTYMEDNIAGIHRVVAPNLSPDTWDLYKPAYDLDQNRLVDAAAIRQKWLDQGQSLNLFVKANSITGGKLRDIYRRGMKLGIKSFYYLRSESEEELKEEVSSGNVECESCQ